MKRIFPILVCLVVSACADWPDTGAAAPSRGAAEWPRLLPLSDIIAGNTAAEAPPDAAISLAARASALRARAALMRRDISNQAEMDALRARLAR